MIELRKTKRQVAVENIFNRNAGEKVAMEISPEAYAHIIDRLTDLYENPLEATLRETVSNGLDAINALPEKQRLNKKVYINLPTLLSPQLVVKDEGIGMSLETVKEIYSKYGASTKRVDFTQIGAYGLGAKAPLAYTDEFMIVTTHNGITTQAKISRTSGKNEMEIVSSEKTDFPNGTTVTIPVKAGDVREVAKINKYDGHWFTDPRLVFDEKNPANFTSVVEFEIPMGDNLPALKGKTTLRRVYDGFSTYSFNLRYILGGWMYKSPVYNSSATTTQVEIYPGLLDFSSSRDSVVANERESHLSTKIRKYLDENRGEILENFFKNKSFYEMTNYERYIAAKLKAECKEGSVIDLLKSYSTHFTHAIEVTKGWSKYPAKQVFIPHEDIVYWAEHSNISQVKEYLNSSYELALPIVLLYNNTQNPDICIVHSVDRLTEKEVKKLHSNLIKLTGQQENKIYLISPYSKDEVYKDISKLNIPVTYLDNNEIQELRDELFPRKEVVRTGERKPVDTSIVAKIFSPNSLHITFNKTIELNDFFEKYPNTAVILLDRHLRLDTYYSKIKDKERVLFINTKDLKALHIPFLEGKVVYYVDNNHRASVKMNEFFKRISKWESGRRVYSLSGYNSISEYFDLSQFDLSEEVQDSILFTKAKTYYVNEKSSEATDYLWSVSKALYHLSLLEDMQDKMEEIKTQAIEKARSLNWDLR